MTDECVHGMNPNWCAMCRAPRDQGARNMTGEYGLHGGRSKQDALNQFCDQLGIAREPVGRGSSLPSHVFEIAARRCAVPLGSMPEIGEAMATAAGLEWNSSCDSRGSISGGGSTVTLEGLDVLNRAIAILLARGC